MSVVFLFWIARFFIFYSTVYILFSSDRSGQPLKLLSMVHHLAQFKIHLVLGVEIPPVEEARLLCCAGTPDSLVNDLSWGSTNSSDEMQAPAA